MVRRVDLTVVAEDGTRSVRQGVTVDELRAAAAAMERESNRRPMIFSPADDLQR